MSSVYQYDIMPPRFDIIGLQEEKKEDASAEAVKYAAYHFYHEKQSLKNITALVRDQLYSTGTSLEQNDDDKMGDGDQSPITDADAQLFYKELFHIGGDFNAHLAAVPRSSSSSGLSEFARHCIAGRHRKVKQMLERNSVWYGKNLDVLIQLLETRETAMRFTPLLLVFCLLRKKAASGKEYAALEQNLLRVVILLLQYGARPDAKDVTGRTVCHYGASIHATDTSMAATTMCIGAATSAHCFGQEIVLRDMDDSNYNGIRGIAAGYHAETGRRIVYLFGRKTETAVRNRNIRLVQHSRKTIMVPPPQKTFNLCDVQDRSGEVCLTELFDSKRVDVATFLMSKHEASIDIPDWNGGTLRSLSLSLGGLIANDVVGPFVAAEVMKRARSDQKKAENNCSACGLRGSKECPLRVCEPCMSVRFCSEDCQNTHWKAGHQRECPKLRKLYHECMVIDKPSVSKGDVADNAILTYNSGEVPMTSYRRPSYAALGEAFTIKVQRVSGRDTLLIYDKTRECEFCLGPDQRVYKRLLEKVKAEEATAGMKAYMAASFDKKGNCSFYLNRRKMKTW